MFKKKTLVVSYIYSFDYSKEPVQLNDLMFKEVPVKQKWGKYVLLNSEDQECFGLSVTKKDFEKALKKGCYYVVFFERHSADNVFKASRLFNKKIRELYTSLHHHQHIVFMRISKKTISVLEVAFSILIVVPF